MSSEAPSIQTENLSRNYGDKAVLSDIHLNIKKGERIWLKGDNGSGKTTLLRVLSAMIYPSDGTVWIEGHHTRKERKKAAQTVSFASANHEGFHAKLTGYENLKLFGQLRGLPPKYIDQFIESWKDLEVFSEALKTPFVQCSTGMKQIINLALAALPDTPILLLDEPFQNLDQKARDYFKTYLKQRNSTLIITSHYAEDLTEMTHSSLIIHKGALRADPH